ncbi:MAG: hypothetical protein LKH74_07920 [Levilactobacillus sp.]|uniref:Uncharacterized protein n=1 Tax=Levilactobacillus suantsaiihabitans TaxID=2487722 RepID=A0A4Z0JAY2_9LACO|nr:MULTISPECIES: hypothetical protein [Levilactobacillus]MCH4123745.1 hypothetical protein [Levilactobacillus sp.]MCI1553843.1 hypothetical protein [Levilactobacillus sp.]MCI1599215.1 hypothetical protein [Levilactobacillus sp.]MCI1606234.1 hypothetical protein [Levilactobacillus sp.]TGD19430.1 hypothetical protein EGT51_04480 [Levilactobacillus suantsaiihabitans]
MMPGSWLTGSLILLTGVVLIIFLLARLIPRTNHDKDTVALLGVFTVVALGLIVLGGYLSLGSWSTAMGMGCW